MGKFDFFPTKLISSSPYGQAMPSHTSRCDERGRILIPVAIREEFGDEFHIVRSTREIILIPVSEEPLKDLAQMGKKAGLARTPLAKIKEEIRKQAMREI